MRAAWYERRGPAHDTLVVGELPDPEPGEGEVRIAVTASGISPGDVKKRAIWLGASQMPYPRVIPHSDGAGTIDAVGRGISADRVGERVWCYGAQSYRPFGTAAEYVVVPDALAVRLSDNRAGGPEELDIQAACLGIAGITGHRAVFADGTVNGLVVLIQGAAGGVGSIAAQLALRDGAHVLAVVRSRDQVARAHEIGVEHVFLDDDPDLSAHIRKVAPNGVHRIAEVDFAGHIELNTEVLAIGGVIASYASSADQPTIPYWGLGFKDVTVRFLGSDDFPAAVKAYAAADLTDALVSGALRSAIAARVPLEEIATAHEMVEHGAHGRVVLDVRTSR